MIILEAEIPDMIYLAILLFHFDSRGLCRPSLAWPAWSGRNFSLSHSWITSASLSFPCFACISFSLDISFLSRCGIPLASLLYGYSGYGFRSNGHLALLIDANSLYRITTIAIWLAPSFKFRPLDIMMCAFELQGSYYFSVSRLGACGHGTSLIYCTDMSFLASISDYSDHFGLCELKLMSIKLGHRGSFSMTLTGTLRSSKVSVSYLTWWKKKSNSGERF